MNTSIVEEVEITKELINEKKFALDICEEFIEFGGVKERKAYEDAKELIAKAKSIFEIDRIMIAARQAS